MYDADLDRVAGELSDWQTVARGLHIGSADITDIEIMHGDNANRRRAFLRRWIDRDGSAATYEKLCEVLRNLKKHGEAERISKNCS